METFFRKADLIWSKAVERFLIPPLFFIPVSSLFVPITGHATGLCCFRKTEDCSLRKSLYLHRQIVITGYGNEKMHWMIPPVQWGE